MNTAELRKIMGDVREKMDLLAEFLSLKDEYERIQQALATSDICTIPDFDKITHVVALACGVTTKEILSRSRVGRINIARHIAMTFCHVPHKPGCSLSDVGKFFNDRNHGTVIHAIKHIKNLRQTDPAFDAQVRMIETKLSKI